MSKRDIKRIADTVKAFENNPRNSVSRQRNRPVPISGFWAVLGDNDGEKYSWKRLSWESGNEVFHPDEEFGEGFKDEDNYAVELYKCEDLPSGLRVFLTPVIGEDFLVFEVSNGGFFEGRGTATGSGSTVSVELKLVTAYTGKIVSANNEGGYAVTNGGWCKVQLIRGRWVLNASRC